MDGFKVALVLGLIILLIAVMYLASKLQKLHRQTRHLRRLVQKLEGAEDPDKEAYRKVGEMGGGD